VTPGGYDSDVKTLLQAAFVAPVDRPIIRDGAILFSGDTILDVGPARALRKAHAEASVVDLENSVLLPGLINAHTHLELTDCTAAGPFTGRFVEWIVGIRDRIRLDPARVEATVKTSVAAGVKQCLRFGVTTIGDISQQMHLARPLLRNGPLRVVSFGEVLGLARRRPRFDELFALATDRACESKYLRVGLSPHAPYTVDLDGYRQSLRYAKEKNLPLATHLAETPDEEVFLRDHAGPFQEMWERLGYWAEPVPTMPATPIRFAIAIGLLKYPTALAHVNYCDDEELVLLAAGRASVIYCPRTHAYFAHPPHRWREMLARGINVAVGTDSCASSPDLNLADDLRLLRRIAPDASAQSIWEMATIRGARALQMDRTIGSLAPGKAADVVAFKVSSNDPLEEILTNTEVPTAVWIGGERVSA
jgi:cytosine/adenosine deaminase-related metal-dependent hydrolase